MTIINYACLQNITSPSIKELPITPEEINEQLDGYNELEHAFSPSRYDLIRYSMTQPLHSQYRIAM